MLMLDPHSARCPRRLVLLVCCTAFATCLAHPAAAEGASESILVTVTDKGCEPNALSVTAGKTTFRIKNQSRRALEWEILSGVRVVEERENILPNVTQSLTATLDVGEYQVTCGLLSNRKGKLTVSTAAGAPPATGPPPGAATREAPPPGAGARHQ